MNNTVNGLSHTASGYVDAQRPSTKPGVATPAPVIPIGNAVSDTNAVSAYGKLTFSPNISLFGQSAPAAVSLLGKTDESLQIPGAKQKSGKFEDPVQLLGHIYQADNLKSTIYDNSRCGATLVFAELVMRGPEQLQAKVDEIRDKIALSRTPDPEKHGITSSQKLILAAVKGLDDLNLRDTSHVMTLADAHHIIDGIYALSAIVNMSDSGTSPDNWRKQLGIASDSKIGPGRVSSDITDMKVGNRMALAYDTTGQGDGHVVMVMKTKGDKWLVHNSQPVQAVKDGLPTGSIREMNRAEISNLVRTAKTSLWLHQ